MKSENITLTEEDAFLTLQTMSIEELIQFYLDKFVYDSRLTELFELCGERNARDFIIGEFKKDFDNNTLVAEMKQEGYVIDRKE